MIRLVTPSWFWRWDSLAVLQATTLLARSLVMAALLLLPLALVLSCRSPDEALQGHSVLYLYLHVPAALSCFFLYALMSAAAVVSLVWRLKAAYAFCCASTAPCLLMAIITLSTGSLWGAETWGTYWIWDARLTSFLFLTLFLALLQLLQWHPRLQRTPRSRKIIAGLILVGLVDVFFIHQSVLWFKTLHQPPSITLLAAPTIDSAFLWPLSISCLFFGLSSIGLSLTRWVILLAPLLSPSHQRREA